MNNNLNFFVQNIHKFANIEPCSQEDIEKIECELNLKLPEAYKVFLKVCGRNSGIFLKEDFSHYKHLIDIQEFNAELRIDCNYPSANKGDLVISTNWDDVINYINVYEGADPPVYAFDRVDWPPKLHCNSFSIFLYKKMNYFLELKSFFSTKK